MAEYTQEELQAKILEVLTTKDKMKNKEIATALDVKKKDVIPVSGYFLRYSAKSVSFIGLNNSLISFYLPAGCQNPADSKK